MGLQRSTVTSTGYAAQKTSKMVKTEVIKMLLKMIPATINFVTCKLSFAKINRKEVLIMYCIFQVKYWPHLINYCLFSSKKISSI